MTNGLQNGIGRMTLGKMLGRYLCLMSPLPDTTTDMWLAVPISLSCQLTPVINVVGRGADGVVLLVMLRWRDLLRVRGASVAPRFNRAEHTKNTDHDLE